MQLPVKRSILRFMFSLILAAATLAAPAIAADIRYVYATVLAHGLGTVGERTGYGHYGYVFLDVVALPANTVIRSRLRIDGNDTSKLTDIEARVFAFAKPAIGKLTLRDITRYEIEFFTEDEKHKGLEGMQRHRAEHFTGSPGGKNNYVELSGVWAGQAVGGKKPTVVFNKGISGPVKTLELSAGASPSKEAERVKKAEAEKKERMAKADAESKAKQSSDQASRDLLAKAKKLAAYCAVEGTRKLDCSCPLPPDVKVCAR